MFSIKALYTLFAILALSTSTAFAQDICSTRDLTQRLPKSEGDSNAEVSLQNVSSSSQGLSLALDTKWQRVLLFCAGDDFLTSVESDIGLTLGTTNVFGGITANVRGYYSRFTPTTYLNPVDNVIEQEINFDQLVNMFSFSGGFETDADFQDVSVLVELGYLPLYIGSDDFKLGARVPGTTWARIGFFVQAGYTTALYQAPTVTPSQDDQQNGAMEGALFRFSLGGQSELILPITIPNTQAVRFLPEASVWYDVLQSRLYGLFGGVLRVDISENVAYDLINIKHGDEPPDFQTGTQFSTGLTIRF